MLRPAADPCSLCGIIRAVKLKSAHIGLNAHLLSTQQSYRSAGISWYIRNLLSELAARPGPYRYTLFLSDRAYQPPVPLHLQRSRWPTHRPPVRILWEQLAQPLVVQRQTLDLLHGLAFVGPLAARLPLVLTVYDLSFMRYPEAFRPMQRWYLQNFTRWSVRRAQAISCISESTRQDVLRFFNVPPERVQTIYCGVEPAFRPLPAAEVAAFRAAQQLPDEFILRLGTIEPRKNVLGVLRAYAAWVNREANVPPLVVAGGKGWYYESVFDEVTRLGLAERVYFPGYVPQEELALWYNAAAMLVYPSFFEGFGLPVLEAMACGTPVITSNVSSLPEVAGNAALQIDPNDEPALSRAMASLWADHDLRRQLREQGLARARTFSWQKTAQETQALYARVLSTPATR